MYSTTMYNSLCISLLFSVCRRLELPAGAVAADATQQHHNTGRADVQHCAYKDTVGGQRCFGLLKSRFRCLKTLNRSGVSE